MADIRNQPLNLNPLSSAGFRFAVKKLPNVNYFCQSVTLPSISMGIAEVNTPLATLPRPGDRLIFDPLMLRFKVNGDLKNYLEIFNWMVGTGHPQSLTQTKALSQSSESPNSRVGSAASYVSDGTLVILNAHKNPSHNIFFRDVFPISLSELTFDSTVQELEYLEATVTFRYLRYDIELV